MGTLSEKLKNAKFETTQHRQYSYLEMVSLYVGIEKIGADRSWTVELIEGEKYEGKVVAIDAPILVFEAEYGDGTGCGLLMIPEAQIRFVHIWPEEDE